MILLKKRERRRFVRVPSQVDIAVHPLIDDFAPFTTTSLDISAEGVAILAPQEINLVMGKTINLWIVLPFDGLSSTQRQTLIQISFDQQLKHRRKGIKN